MWASAFKGPVHECGNDMSGVTDSRLWLWAVTLTLAGLGAAFTKGSCLSQGWARWEAVPGCRAGCSCSTRLWSKAGTAAALLQLSPAWGSSAGHPSWPWCAPELPSASSLKWQSTQGRCPSSIHIQPGHRGSCGSHWASSWGWGLLIPCLLWALVPWRPFWWQSQHWSPSWSLMEASVLFPAEQPRGFAASVLQRSDFPVQFLRDSSGLSWGECNVAVSQYRRFWGLFFLFLSCNCVPNPGGRDAGEADKLWVRASREAVLQ